MTEIDLGQEADIRALVKLRKPDQRGSCYRLIYIGPEIYGIIYLSGARSQWPSYAFHNVDRHCVERVEIASSTTLDGTSRYIQICVRERQINESGNSLEELLKDTAAKLIFAGHLRPRAQLDDEHKARVDLVIATAARRHALRERNLDRMNAAIANLRNAYPGRAMHPAIADAIIALETLRDHGHAGIDLIDIFPEEISP